MRGHSGRTMSQETPCTMQRVYECGYIAVFVLVMGALIGYVACVVVLLKHPKSLLGN